MLTIVCLSSYVDCDGQNVCSLYGRALDTILSTHRKNTRTMEGKIDPTKPDLSMPEYVGEQLPIILTDTLADIGIDAYTSHFPGLFERYHIPLKVGRKQHNGFRKADCKIYEVRSSTNNRLSPNCNSYLKVTFSRALENLEKKLIIISAFSQPLKPSDGYAGQTFWVVAFERQSKNFKIVYVTALLLDNRR